MRYRCFLAAFVLAGTSLHAGELVFPVMTGIAGDRALSTTVQIKNAGKSEATCTFTYRGPERVGTPLISREIISPGKTNLYEDFLSDVAGAGSVLIDCSEGVEVFARIQDAETIGASFRAGRLFRPFATANALGIDAKRNVKARSDLVLVELAGERLKAAVVISTDGRKLAETSYDIPPFGLRLVNLRAILEQVPEVDVAVVVLSGKGKLAIGKEVRDAALANVALRRDRVVRAASQSATSTTAMRGMCGFKAAPFVEPMNGLCYFRDRWYDPKTGTFLTPDRAGYLDSANLYSYGAGDPINNNDPTGLFIDESRILASPLQSKYIGWRDRYLKSPLGKKIWDQLDALPASVFTLEIGPMAAIPGVKSPAGAETRNFYDAAGVQNRATIEFNPDFGRNPGSGPPLSIYYKHGIDIYAHDPGGYVEYAFAHEIGHVLGGWDPTMAPQTRQFTMLGSQIDATIPQFSMLRQIANRNPAQQQQYAQVVQQRQNWYQQQGTLKNQLEPYADEIGYQIYRSFRQTNPRKLGIAPVGGKNFNPPPQLPKDAMSNIPDARTP